MSPPTIIGNQRGHYETSVAEGELVKPFQPNQLNALGQIYGNLKSVGTNDRLLGQYVGVFDYPMIASLREGSHTDIVDIPMLSANSGDSWELKIAPLVKTNGFSKSWTIWETKLKIAEELALGVVPTGVEINARSGTSILRRFGTMFEMDGEFITADLPGIPGASWELMVKTRSVINTAILTARLLVREGVMSLPNVYLQNQKTNKHDVIYSSIADAINRMKTDFAILNKNQTGVESLAVVANQYARNQNVVFTEAIVPGNQFMQELYGPDFEDNHLTNAKYAGAERAHKNIYDGPEAIKNKTKRLTRHEAQIYDIHGVGPVAFAQREVVMGRYFYVGNYSESMFSAENYSPKTTFDTLLYDGSDGTYRGPGFITFLDSCGRFDMIEGNESFSSHMKNFVNALTASPDNLYTETGLKSENGYEDMFVNQDSNDKFYLTEYLIDMKSGYTPTEFIQKMAHFATARLRKEGVNCGEDECNLIKMIDFMKTRNKKSAHQPEKLGEENFNAKTIADNKNFAGWTTYWHAKYANENETALTGTTQKYLDIFVNGIDAFNRLYGVFESYITGDKHLFVHNKSETDSADAIPATFGYTGSVAVVEYRKFLMFHNLFARFPVLDEKPAVSYPASAFSFSGKAGYRSFSYSMDTFNAWGGFLTKEEILYNAPIEIVVKNPKNSDLLGSDGPDVHTVDIQELVTELRAKASNDVKVYAPALRAAIIRILEKYHNTPSGTDAVQNYITILTNSLGDESEHDVLKVSTSAGADINATYEAGNTEHVNFFLGKGVSFPKKFIKKNTDDDKKESHRNAIYTAVEKITRGKVLEQAFAFLFLGLHIANVQTWLTLYMKDVLLPISFLAVGAACKATTAGILFMGKGKDDNFGAQYGGGLNAEVSWNTGDVAIGKSAASKKMLVNLTWYMVFTLFNPKNFLLKLDAMLLSTGSGWSVRPSTFTSDPGNMAKKTLNHQYNFSIAEPASTTENTLADDLPLVGKYANANVPLNVQDPITRSETPAYRSAKFTVFMMKIARYLSKEDDTSATNFGMAVRRTPSEFASIISKDACIISDGNGKKYFKEGCTAIGPRPGKDLINVVANQGFGMLTSELPPQFAVC